MSNLPFLLKFSPQSLDSRLDFRGNTVRNKNHRLQINFANISSEFSFIVSIWKRNSTTSSNNNKK